MDIFHIAEERSPLLVWGAGGHGRVVADVARQCGYIVVGYVDADRSKVGDVADSQGARVIVQESDFLRSVEGDRPLQGSARFVALGIGDNNTRLHCAQLLGPLCAPPIVHPDASISEEASLDRGVVVFARAVVNTGADLQLASIVNSGAIIEHDVTLAAGVHVSPGAVLTGGVIVGSLTWIGAGATVIPNISIGANSIIGAGAVVIRSVPDNVKVVGNPARIIP